MFGPPNQPWSSYIAGNWVDDPDARAYETTDPGRSGSTVARYQLASVTDAHRAAVASRDAAESWAQTTAGERGELVYGLIDLWRTRTDELAEIVTLEMGKPWSESFGEAHRAVSEMRYWAGEATRIGDRTFPSTRARTTISTIRQPIGPVAAITPWNFPILSPLRKVVPALVCGCPVTLKPALQAPGASVLLAAMLDELDVPAGVFNLLVGGGADVGAALIEHPDIAGISFTGSTDVGLQISTSAARRNVSVQLEMGGKNAAVVASYADTGHAAAEIAGAAFAASGQRCTAVSRVIVLPHEREAVENALVEQAESIAVGHGMAEGTRMGPLSSKDQLNKVTGYVEGGVRDGARLLTGGCRLTDGGLPDGYYYAPTVLTDVRPDTPLATDEVFGPVLAVIPVESFSEAVAVANDTRYGLSASVFTDDMDLADEFVSRVRTGKVHVNHGTTSEGHVPFGGVKQSGLGAYGIGDTSAEFFTALKAVYHMHRASPSV